MWGNVPDSATWNGASFSSLTSKRSNGRAIAPSPGAPEGWQFRAPFPYERTEYRQSATMAQGLAVE